MAKAFPKHPLKLLGVSTYTSTVARHTSCSDGYLKGVSETYVKINGRFKPYVNPFRKHLHYFLIEFLQRAFKKINPRHHPVILCSILTCDLLSLIKKTIIQIFILTLSNHLNFPIIQFSLTSCLLLFLICNLCLKFLSILLLHLLL